MKIITYAAIALLGTLSTSSASAGCGKENRFKFPMSNKRQTQPTRQTPGTPRDVRPGGLVGLWLSTVTVDGQPAFQSFEAFTSDGLEFLNDNGSPLEGNVCFGVWATDGKTVTVYHPSWNYDPSGNLIGTVVITEQLTLDADSRTFAGTVSAEVFDLNGNSQGVVLQGALTGTKITM